MSQVPTGRPGLVFDQLRAWILDGSLVPGQRLPVRDVAEGMGVSTMPVRKALTRLGEVGLVTQRPNRGAIVSELSLGELRDLYGLRRILEPPAIRLGVEAMTPERLRRMRATLDRLAAAVPADDLATVLDADEEFLGLVHAAIGNEQIMRVVRFTWERVRVYKLLFTTTAQVDAGEHILADDARLLEAAELGDGGAAEELILDSLVNAELQLVDFLRGCDAAPARPRGESLAAVLLDLRRSTGTTSAMASS